MPTVVGGIAERGEGALREISMWQLEDRIMYTCPSMIDDLQVFSVFFALQPLMIMTYYDYHNFKYSVVFIREWNVYGCIACKLTAGSTSTALRIQSGPIEHWHSLSMRLVNQMMSPWDSDKGPDNIRSLVFIGKCGKPGVMCFFSTG